MKLYRYVSIGPDGKKTSGRVNAADKAYAQRFVTGSGELLVELELVGTRRWLKFERRRDIDLATASSFALELSGLIEAGAPLKQALDIQSDGTSDSARLAKSIGGHIEAGSSLSNGLRQAGGAATLLAEFAAAGEAGAGLSTMLDVGGRFLRARNEAIVRLKRALAYPLFIGILACAALIMMIVYVAPTLAPMLEDQGSGGLVLILADIGDWLSTHSSIFFLALALIVLVLVSLQKFGYISRAWRQCIFLIPFFGSIKRDLDVGQACEVVSVLIENGRSMESALHFASSTSTGLIAYEFEAIADRLRDGQVLSYAFSQAVHLPSDLRRLVKLGEASSAFPRAIRQAGSICSERGMAKLDRIAVLAGPVLVIGMGGMIAGLMLSVLGSLAGIGGADL